MGDLAVEGNFVFCLIIVDIFIGLGRAYRLGGEYFEVIKRGEGGDKPQMDGTIFMREFDP